MLCSPSSRDALFYGVKGLYTITHLMLKITTVLQFLNYAFLSAYIDIGTIRLPDYKTLHNRAFSANSDGNRIFG